MRDSGCYNVGHWHGLAGIAGYVVVGVRAQPAPRPRRGGCTEARIDLAVLEGAGQYVRARERAAALNARLGEQAGACVRFGVDVIYTDGCRMPW
jgi:hypothetical protein